MCVSPRTWRGEVSDAALAPAWRRASGHIKEGALPVRWVRGPVSATICVVLALGWQPLSPTVWQGGDGAMIDLAATPPKRVRALAGKAAAAAAWWSAAASRRDASGSEGGVDLGNVQHVRRQADARRDGAVLCVVTGGVTTAARRQRQGLQEDDCCENCGEPGADKTHLFWRCPAHADLRARRGFDDEVIANLAARAPACFMNRALVPKAWTDRQPVAGRAAQGGQAGSGLFGLVATDGAAKHPQDRRRRRAAWGFHAVESVREFPLRLFGGRLPDSFPGGADGCHRSAPAGSGRWRPYSAGR